MKTTPLLTLAGTVIAGMLLSSCSFISVRHYNLNLVKVEKNITSEKKAKATEDEVTKTENKMYASAEKTYDIEEFATVKLKTNLHLANDTKAKKYLNKKVASSVAQKYNKVQSKDSKFSFPNENIDNKPWDWASFLGLSFSLLGGLFLSSIFTTARNSNLIMALIFYGIIPLIFGILGLLFGLIGYARVVNGKAKGLGLTIAAITLSVLLILIPFLFFFLIF
jgi:hypothetical protein